MALGSPWLYAVTKGDSGFQTYTACLAVEFALCVGLFAYLLLSHTTLQPKWRQLLMISMAVSGLSPAVQMDSFDAKTKLACLLLFIGYTVFYTLNLPDALFPSNAFSNSPLNSHVLWHMCASSAQLCFVAMTFQG